MRNIFSSIARIFAAEIPSSPEAQTPAGVSPNANDQKAVIVFFSRPNENYSVGLVKEGNTKRLMDMIAKKTGLEIIEIIPTQDYPKAYRATTEQVKKELAEGYRPPINPVKDISGYDTIILGYPIWWGEVPPPMQTWLESVDLSSKKIFPVATHEGSRFGSSLSNLKQLAKGADIKEGLTVYGHDAQNPNNKTIKAVDAWLQKNGLIN